MKRYKVVTNDLRAPFQTDFQYEIGKQYICTNFDSDKSNDCSSGFYATNLDGIIYAFRNNNQFKVFECEVSGKKIEIDQFKMRYEKIKLIREIPIRELEELIKEQSKKMDYMYYEALFPKNPLLLPKKKLTNKHKKLLKEYGIKIEKDLDKVKFYCGKGCAYCNNTGYRGRMSIVESIWVTDNIKKIMESGDQSSEIEKELKDQDFISIEQDGIIKAIKGEISLQDVKSAISN